MPPPPAATLSRVARPKSAAAFARAQAVTPGGVNSPARAFGGVGGSPLFIAKAHGATLTDLDGYDYLDLIGSWGPMIWGHAHPEVLAAATEAATRGTSYGAPCENETRLAELVVEMVPSIEMVRFTSSGTEAAMSAVRLARGATGRDMIVKFAGNYHGHVDALLVSAGSSALTLGVPDSPGVPASCYATHDRAAIQRLRGLTRSLPVPRRPDCRRDARTGRRQHGAGRADPGVPR